MVFQLEEERKFLGGDTEHTVLVKGLDFALLEQNKARAATSTVDDDELERAFVEGTTNAKKRTREDIIRDLKNKRLRSDSGEATSLVDVPLDDVKKTGKFKPIGFKPVGSADGTKKKKVKAKNGEEEGAKKKKKKQVPAETVRNQDDTETPSIGPAEKPSAQASSSQTLQAATPAEPEPEPSDDNMDIFAGVGEYAGVDLGDDSDEDANEDKAEAWDEASDPPPLKGKWIEVDEPGASAPAQSTLVEQSRVSSSEPPPPRGSASPEREDGEEEEQFTRLAPLASSAIPSIKELLAMDDEVERKEKRKARKEKKKGNLTAEGKVDRDYQRLAVHIGAYSSSGLSCGASAG